MAELKDLYSRSLREFHKVLKKGGRAVMVWPVLASNTNNLFLDPDIGAFKLIKPPILQFMSAKPNDKMPGLTSRGTLLYGRPGQKVWREIAILEK
jgi:hypothetical protein